MKKKRFKKVKIGPKKVEIPEDWDIRTLDSVTKNKGQYGANESAQNYNDNKYRYIRITDINENGKIDNTKKKGVKKKGNKKYLLKKGDIIFSRTGNVGLTYLHNKKNNNYVFAGYLIRFVPDTKKTIPEYLYNYTKSYFYKSWINSMTRSTTLGNINKTINKTNGVRSSHLYKVLDSFERNVNI